MPRVNVYLPDELWREVQPLTGVLNLSQLLQTALQSALSQERQRYREQADLETRVDLGALRNRFGEERAVLYREGFRIGLDCANLLRYADLRAAHSVAWDTARVFETLPKRIRSEFSERSSEATARSEDTARMAAIQDEIADGFVGALHRMWELAAGVPTVLEQMNELKARADASEAQVAAAEARLAELRAHMGQLQARNESVAMHGKEYNAEREAIVQQLAAMVARLQATESSRTRIQADLQALQESDRGADKPGRASKRLALERQLAHATAEIAHLAASAEELERRRDELTQQNEALRESFRELVTERRQLADAVAAVQTAIQEGRATQMAALAQLQLVAQHVAGSVDEGR